MAQATRVGERRNQPLSSGQRLALASAIVAACLLTPAPFGAIRIAATDHGQDRTFIQANPADKKRADENPEDALSLADPVPDGLASLNSATPKSADPMNAAEAIEAAIANAGRRNPYEPPTVSAYAPRPDPADATILIDPTARLGLDLTGLREGLEAYRTGDIAKGDAAAATAKNLLVATVLEWSLIRTHPRAAGYRRISQFVANHPDWPMNDWLRKQAEESLYSANPPAKSVIVYFQNAEPVTALGRLALARALLTEGDSARANALARILWREDNLNASLETALLKNFSSALSESDHKYRADRLLYKEQIVGAMRASALTSKDVQALVKIRAAAVNESANEKTFNSVPVALKNDPGFIFAKAQWLRRAKKYAEAATLMQTAPREKSSIIAGDEWWAERRMLARKILDTGDAKTAYRLVADHGAQANDMQVEAEFLAGWIALRFMKDPPLSVAHFEAAQRLAQTPISRARAAYWRGRAAEALEQDSSPFYEKAALESATFYGQLARLKLGQTDVAMRRADAATGEDRAESVRATELLYAIGAKNLAVPLVFAAAKSLVDQQQMAALAHVVVKDRDAKTSLTLGKLASQRGIAMDELAFPTYGVPAFAPFVNSAPLAIVYSIARQESAFDAKAVSSAGALGLMQMIPSTARRTAQRVGVGFDPSRMTSDPIFNAQLGAAHLGDLLNEQRNSLILTFAAYNAGGGRVKEWIAAHGDPRSPNVDPIDWIELIPIAETRNYVQRVLENLTIYRARMDAPDAARTAADALRREARIERATQ